MRNPYGRISARGSKYTATLELIQSLHAQYHNKALALDDVQSGMDNLKHREQQIHDRLH